ncbi:hypothetical protein GCM10011574_47240 [Microbispora bryophytorum]|uniref:Uncharacterized protein n=1 Tax=Microbispora bryophytorum TaxID=1460882 RepID=A0A8H9LI60_9ACTN|nr:hypothetical protein GCM10011574_47240 [Microbispora bryophytorum]
MRWCQRGRSSAGDGCAVNIAQYVSGRDRIHGRTRRLPKTVARRQTLRDARRREAALAAREPDAIFAAAP